MAYMAMVTFDLDGAHPNDYTALGTRLAKLGFEKKIEKSTGKTVKTPDNTYTRRSDEQPFETATKHRDSVETEFRRLAGEVGVKCKKLLIFVGKTPFSWAVRSNF